MNRVFPHPKRLTLFVKRKQTDLSEIQTQVSLTPYTTLKAGGPAERFLIVRNRHDFADAVIGAHLTGETVNLLGSGSNILPSDDGVPGLTILNCARKISIESNGLVEAETGCCFQELFLKSVQSGFRGLEFAVGIPGTLGGALVSNAGAYRSCISEFLTELEVVVNGRCQWVSPEWMEFSYRNSRLRMDPSIQVSILRVRMKLERGDSKASYDEAREYQRQRIGKQPPSPSAGSFFKNVNDVNLAQSLPDLPAPLKKAGVVPAGYLIEAAGLKGVRYGGARMGVRHANFMLNVDNASAFEIYRLAQQVKSTVKTQFDVQLEEEVLYFGNWKRFMDES